VFAQADPDVTPTELDLNEVVADATALVARPFGEHIVITTNLTASPSTIRADGGQLSQVMLNLLLNARDALPDGGTIRVDTALDEQDPGYIVLEVSDDGAGMQPEVVRRAFEPFFTTKPLTHGSGLGLSTAHSVIAAAGGRIGITSEVGRGTTIRIALPLVPSG
jgi:signal transduction histidine kinase